MPDDRPGPASETRWKPAAMAAAKQSAFDWVTTHEAWLSKRHTEVWNFHESAWREYRSAAWYVKLLRSRASGRGSRPACRPPSAPPSARVDP
jgi:hypothetical protein